MQILQETAQSVRQKLGSDFEKLTIDRIAVGLFFTGVKLSNLGHYIKEFPEGAARLKRRVSEHTR